jgi:hypothetical protein
MENIVIAIRTYKRINTIGEDTLKLIEEQGLPYPVYIFCPEDEKNEYMKRYKDKKNIHITTRGQSLKEVNDRIIDYFPTNRKVVQMDDDLKDFLEWNGTEGRAGMVRGDLKKYIEEGFKLCEENGFKLWGFYSVNNWYFMKDSPPISKGLKFIMGGIHGFINDDKTLKPMCGFRDDYERSMMYYEKHGGMIRFNHCKADNKTLTNEGGLVSERTIELMKTSQEYLVGKYPHLCFAKTCKSKYPEIQLKNIPYSIQYHLEKQLDLITWSPNRDRPNVSGLDTEKTKSKQNPVGNACLSYTFGYLKPRRACKGTLSLTKVSERFPLIYELAKQYIASFAPDFQYTTICINKNIVCKKHTDKYNTHPSLLISFGDYTEGGNLYIEDKDGKVKKHNTKNKHLIFSGNDPHWNDEPNGKRYSFVYFNHNIPK